VEYEEYITIAISYSSTDGQLLLYNRGDSDPKVFKQKPFNFNSGGELKVGGDKDHVIILY